MDLVFDGDKGMSFTVEVGYFDTIQEIKEKVTRYHGIPVHKQSLKFDGKTLPNDLNIHSSDILDGSHLNLITSTNHQQTLSRSWSHRIKILLKPFGVSIEVDTSDPVSKIKEKMNEMKGMEGMEGIPLSRMVVYANGSELHDCKTLHECQLVDGSDVEVTLIKAPTPTPTPTPPPCVLDLMKVFVMSKSGEKIGMEVNPSSNVGELRKELERVRQQGVRFRLPEEGYFFIYKQNVMEEDHSFRWHRVGQGDTVEIFNGCVTGGS